MGASAATALLCLRLLAGPGLCAAAAEEPEPAELGRSAVPIIGYDDKRSWLFGAAGFLYTDREPGINAGFFALSNGDNFHSAGLTYDQRPSGRWSGAMNLIANRDFDNYYGEGGLTRPEDHVYVGQTRFEARPLILYRLVPHLRLGAFADFRSRQEEDTHLIPDESSSSLGLHLQWDGRDKLINPRKGSFLQLNVSRNTGVEPFLQLELDLRRFSRLRRSLVLGSRLAFGSTLGKASYLFRYRLGGLHLLRGYKDNRFRGSEFFVVQEELRWMLLKWLSANVSLDLGAVRDVSYEQLKSTVQAGLRLGLPPGWGQKMRLDFGIGLDQSTLQFQFGEIF